MKLIRTTPLPGCKGPSAMDIDRKARHLFIGCANNTGMVVEADSGKIVAKFPIGEHVDAAAYDASAGTLFLDRRRQDHCD